MVCVRRYVYCTKCFSEIQGDTVTVGDDPLTATIILKTHFKEMKNNSIDRESYVSFSLLGIIYSIALFDGLSSCEWKIRLYYIRRKVACLDGIPRRLDKLIKAQYILS